MLPKEQCLRKRVLSPLRGSVSLQKKVAEEITIDDPEKEGDHIGPLFDKIQFDRVQNMIDVGIKEGASVLTGGLGKPQGLEDGWFVKPTIFYNVTNNMRVAQEEIFGPVLVIIPFSWAVCSYVFSLQRYF